MTGGLPRPGRAAVVGGLLGGAATSAGIALTATSGWLVVRASERPVILTLLAAIVAVRAFGMARPFFRYLERVHSHDAALADLARRRTEVYEALIPLTPARLGRRSRSRVLTGIVDDLTDVVEAEVRVTVPVLSSAVAGVVATVLAAAFAPAVGVVVAGLLAVVAAACALAWRVESGSRDALLEARAEISRVCDLVARHAGELRAIGAEDAALRMVDAAQATLARAVRRQSRGRAAVAAVLPLGTAGATIAAAVVVDPRTVGAPVAALLVLLPVAVGDALAPLVEAVRSLARARGSSARIAAILERDPAVSDRGTTPLPADPDVRLDGVTASWTGATQDLDPTDLRLGPGRHLGIVGPNGSGKSTLLAVLTRTLDVTGGRHTIGGTDVRDVPLAATRATVAVVDDEPHVFAATLAENLRFARPGCDDAAIRRALLLAGLGPWSDALPDGLETVLGSGGRGLSGGERTRLGIARAVLADRPTVVLDEPAAHLDHVTATAVLDDVLDAARDRAVVVVSHRPEARERFDEVLDLGRRPALAPTTKE